MRTKEPTLSDPRLEKIREALSSLEEGASASSPHQCERAHAAVSLVLRCTPELKILLIRRAEVEGDPWSGHMALPGGRCDPSDESLLHTAIRETMEETALSLEEAGSPLGRMEPLIPNNPSLPPISIFPFIFGVGEEVDARVASHEVDEVLWTPLSTLRDPGSQGSVTIHHAGAERDFPCFRLGDRVIWGLTYRILTDFFERLEEGAPDIV